MSEGISATGDDVVFHDDLDNFEHGLKNPNTVSKFQTRSHNFKHGPTIQNTVPKFQTRSQNSKHGPTNPKHRPTYIYIYIYIYNKT